jgi:hypothetical protein
MVASNAYRETLGCASSAQPPRAASSRTRPKAYNRAHSALTRNILIAGVSLGSLAFGSAGMAVFGGGDMSSPTPYISSRSALKLALADPVAPVIVKRDPRIALETPAGKPIAVAAQPDVSATEPRRAAPKTPRQPLQRETMSATQLASAEAVPFPIARVEPVERAEPRERIAERIAMAFASDFTDPETTGSIGKPDKPLAAPEPDAKPQVKPQAVALPPAAAKLTAVAPSKPVPAKPARPLTPHEKLWGPVKFASLSPANAMRDMSANPANDGLPRAPYDPLTAVYVIGDKKVYLPDGSSLEAHSGLGQYMDDVRFAHLRMRGVTPPHVYDMKLREALFHGVEAIRLKPIGGEEAIFGRDGLLAHTYMLGPNGQSNGCVSFRNYDAFLEAFKSGKINRLAVIGKLD